MLDKYRIIQLMFKAGTMTDEAMWILTRVYEMTNEELISIANGTHETSLGFTEFEPLEKFCQRQGIKFNKSTQIA